MRRSISFQSGQLGPSSGGRRPQSVSAAARPPALPGQLSPPSGGRRFSVTALSQFQPGPLNPSSGDRRPQTVTPSHASDTRVVPMERYNLLALDHMRLRSELEVKSKELAKLQDIFAQNAEYQKEIAVLQEKLRQEIKDHDAAKAQASSIEITCNTLNSRFRDLEARSRKVAELIKPMLIRFEEHSSEICSLRKTVSGLKANEKSISTKYELAKKHVVEAQKNLSAIEQEAAELCEQLNNPTSGHYATKKRHSAQCDDPFDNEVPLGAQLHHEEPKRELSVASKTSVEGERAITTGELRAKSTKDPFLGGPSIDVSYDNPADITQSPTGEVKNFDSHDYYTAITSQEDVGSPGRALTDANADEVHHLLCDLLKPHNLTEEY